jgi:hypothetical protein
MRFHNYSLEKKDKTKSDVYIKAAIIGVVLGVIFIVSGMGLKMLILFLIKYWMWAIGIIMALLFIKDFLRKRKRVEQVQNEIRY